jgi:predicted nucleic acid-binding protein
VRRCYIDTSALAKWYLEEPGSENFERFVNRQPVRAISRLVTVELRCLLARRRRTREISLGYEAQAYATFRGHLLAGVFVIQPLLDEHMIDALELLERLQSHPLRTLDALHLAAARTAGCDGIATADRVMAEAARAVGLTVEFFGAA